MIDKNIHSGEGILFQEFLLKLSLGEFQKETYRDEISKYYFQYKYTEIFLQEIEYFSIAMLVLL